MGRPPGPKECDIPATANEGARLRLAPSIATIIAWRDGSRSRHATHIGQRLNPRRIAALWSYHLVTIDARLARATARFFEFGQASPRSWQTVTTPRLHGGSAVRIRPTITKLLSERAVMRALESSSAYRPYSGSSIRAATPKPRSPFAIALADLTSAQA
jgi:hypothetical protein